MDNIRLANLLIKAADALETKDQTKVAPKAPVKFDINDLGEDLRVDINEAKELAKRSGQRGGAVGDNPIVPRYVAKIAKKGQKILDFGAGAKAKQTIWLREMGFDVTAYDFHNIQGLHDPAALERQYDIVFASNVLNTASNKDMLVDSLQKIKKAIKPGGIAIFNYPSTPRYWVTTKFPAKPGNSGGIPAAVIAMFIKKICGQEPQLIGGTPSVPIWQISG